MTQTRLESLIEAGVNLIIGYVVALLFQIYVFPMFGIHVPLSTNLWLTFWFAMLSLVRSYVLRRWFNARLHRAAQVLAAKAAGRSPLISTAQE